MKKNIKIRAYQIPKEKTVEKEIKNIDLDNDKSKLYSQDEINKIEENYYIDKTQNRITFKDKIIFILYIMIGIILSLHSFHFIFSEYVRRII